MPVQSWCELGHPKTTPDPTASAAASHQALSHCHRQLSILKKNQCIYLKFYIFSTSLHLFSQPHKGQNPLFSSLRSSVSQGAPGTGSWWFLYPQTHSQPFVGWTGPNSAPFTPPSLGAFPRQLLTQHTPERRQSCWGCSGFALAGSCPISLPAKRKGDKTKTRSTGGWLGDELAWQQPGAPRPAVGTRVPSLGSGSEPLPKRRAARECRAGLRPHSSSQR